MTPITVRQRNQVTIPKAIAEAAGLTEGTVCDLHYENGVITIKVPWHREPGDSILKYAGIARGVWGETPEEVDRTIRELRDSWDRELPG
jgi:bifunctional DNA-binding transcriptional regulator/antitoxin component of YhaV-PrlF toxin-antitoxin module